MKTSELVERILLSVVDWVEENRGWIECVSFNHPKQGGTMKNSLREAIAKEVTRTR